MSEMIKRGPPGRVGRAGVVGFRSRRHRHDQLVPGVLDSGKRVFNRLGILPVGCHDVTPLAHDELAGHIRRLMPTIDVSARFAPVAWSSVLSHHGWSPASMALFTLSRQFEYTLRGALTGSPMV